ncbi:O-antigen ligase family protein [Bacteroidota bacterium]
MDTLLTRKNRLPAAIILIFIVANSFLLIHEIFWAALLPLGLLLIYLLFIAPNWIVLLLSLVTPLSFNYEIDYYGASVSIPTEPLLLVLTIVYIIKLLVNGNVNKEVLRQPISIAILLNLTWILITSVSSTIPLVSLKFLIARIWYIAVFYFIGIELFKEIKSIKLFIWLFASTLVIAVLITLFKHSHHFFAQEWANKVTYPFFKDHTIYGAIIALFIPLMYGFLLKGKVMALSNVERMIAGIYSVILSIGLIFSYTRAAWVSVIVSALMVLFLYFKFRFKHLVIITLIFLCITAVFWDKAQARLTKTESVSSTELKDHFESISNVTTDVSNTERINRWNSAIRMFKQKPFLGWGPGTYMFQYAPFQLDREKTAISTNFGTLGNAHSEYLGPLAESGVFGMLTFVILAVIIIYKALDIFYHAKSRKISLFAALILLSLITYLSHGVMNNFLHTDKASVPFWAFIGMLTALDLYHKQSTNTYEEN